MALAQSIKAPKKVPAKKRDPIANKGGIERMEYSIARYVEPQTM